MLHVAVLLLKSHASKMCRFKQGVYRCKMAGARFYSIAKSRARISNVGMADCGVH
jgi:hypothetical protein